MNRQAIDGGGWFDVEAARRWDEGSYYDGSNFVSLATGSQWDHEELYLTRTGRWILSGWSQWQGSATSWREISADEAADWLVQQGHEIPPCLDDSAAAMEI